MTILQAERDELYLIGESTETQTRLYNVMNVVFNEPKAAVENFGEFFLQRNHERNLSEFEEFQTAFETAFPIYSNNYDYVKISFIDSKEGNTWEFSITPEAFIQIEKNYLNN